MRAVTQSAEARAVRIDRTVPDHAIERGIFGAGNRTLPGYLVGEGRATTAFTVTLLLVASIAEAVGMLALFPVITRIIQPQAAQPSTVVAFLERMIRSVGLEPAVATLLTVLVAAVSLKALLTWLAMRRVGYVAAELATELRLRLLQALLRARWELFVHERLGDFASAVGHEATMAAAAYMRACEALSRAIQTAMYAGLIFVVSWQFGLIAVVAIAALAFLMNGYSRAGRRHGQAGTRALREFTSTLLDAVHGMKPIRAMAAESQVLNRLRASACYARRAIERQTDTSEGVKAVQEPLLIVAIALGLLAAARFFPNQPAVLTMLGLLSFRMSIQLRLCLSAYQTMVTIQPAFSAVHRTIGRAAACVEPPLGDRTPPAITRGICFDRVTFAYGRNVVLDDLTMELPANSLTAIVGPSGAGKSTLLDLLVALQRPSAGEVLIDDQPLPELDLTAWRCAIGFVPQDPRLVGGTILDNVRLGDRSITEAQVVEALRAAGVWSFVESLDDCIHAVVGEQGLGLSAGQRQRLAIARALARRPALLILDEATANLDPTTAAEIVELLLALRESTTIVTVTHQPQLYPEADRIYEIVDGRAELLHSRSPVAVCKRA